MTLNLKRISGNTVFVLIVLTTLGGCSANEPQPLPPTIDIDSIVQTAVAAAQPTATTVVIPAPTPDIQSTVKAAVAEALNATVAARPVITPEPTDVPTSTPTPTATPVPTPTPIPTTTPTAIPTSTTVPTATSTPLPSVIGIIKQFSGKNSTSTEKFSVSVNPWKFVWSYSPIDRTENCFVSLIGESTKSLLIETVYEWAYGEKFVHDTVGEFYLNVNCVGIEWKFFITSADGGLVEGG